MNLNKKSFTIIELLTVIAIIAIIAVASVPAWAAFSASAALRSEGEKFLSDIREAQQGAVSEQFIYAVKINPEENKYKITKFVIDDENLDNSAVETDVGERFLESGIEIDSAAFADGIVEFNSFGSASSGGEIILKNSRGNDYIIKITAAGIIKSM